MKATAMLSYQNQLLAAGIGGERGQVSNEGLNPLGAFFANRTQFFPQGNEDAMSGQNSNQNKIIKANKEENKEIEN
jgi:hypothetical protein